ncbi:hypothetical protein [Limosilactobacillus ingluviei]|uniref:Uncharacterized protein n=1 Tax=Limosilactobacillus ingluviei DSM 15946 TaxID=1423760 RepID=A0A0R1UBW4_9LACO|nr:hypothetical protein [Limosilactobacillus ingluviei]KRL88472.1 hypothetical protein FC43_GL000417 [Limosilactobacillus ingluviei DSM 15946]
MTKQKLIEAGGALLWLGMLGGNLYHHHYGTVLLLIGATIGWAVFDRYRGR